MEHEGVLEWAAEALQSATALEESERQEEAILILQEVIEVLRPLEKELPPLMLAGVFDWLAQVYHSVRNWQDERAALTEGLERKTATLGLHDVVTLKAINDLSLPLIELGEFETAFKHLSQGLAAARSIPADQELLVLTLANLGAVLHGMSRYTDALEMLQEAEELARKTMSCQDPNYGKVLQGLGHCHHGIGNLSESMAALEKAHSIFVDRLGEEHAEALHTQLTIGKLSFELGEYARAQHLLQAVLEIQLERHGEESPNLAPTLVVLGQLYYGLGDYDHALAHYKRALTLGGSLWGETHVEYARILNHMADLYSTVDHFDEAEQLYLQCLGLFAVTPGTETEEYAETLAGLAGVYDYLNRFDDAERYFRQALAIQYRVLGPKHRTLANTLHSFGRLYYVTGRYQAAEEQFNLSVEAEPGTLGMNGMDRATTLVDLALVQAATDRPYDALHSLQEAEAIHEELIAQIFAMGSEEQRMAFLSKLEWRRDVFLSLVWQYLSQDPDCVRLAFELVLHRKSMGARMLFLQRGALARQTDPVVGRLWQELVDCRGRISRLRMEGAAPGGEEQYLDAVGQAEADRRWLEQQLAQRVTPEEVLEAVRTVDTDAVSDALPGGAALLEVVRFDEFPFEIVGRRNGLTFRYLTFFVRADGLQMVDLGLAAEMDARIEDARRWMADQKRRLEMAEDGTPLWTNDWQLPRLRMLLFDPLASLLDGISRLVIAPDGMLALVPFEIIRLESGEWFLDRFVVHYVQCGRDLAQRTELTPTVVGGPLVMACPAFELNAPPSQSGATRGALAQALERSAIKFTPLPSTRQEGERIADFLGVVPFLGDQVLKTVLKSAQSPRILHVATHGFFLTEPDAHTTSGILIDPPSRRLSRAELVDPLLRSGLALSGAQTWLEGGTLPPEAEDGILTADDVTTMDLRGTELVVLSACNTGVGEIRSGEGVYGLRRAFFVAGARTVIMSLWSVSDESTALLMTEFYRQLLSNGLPPHEALRKAQQVTRDYTNASGHRLYQHPYYWGAFICEGNPQGGTD